MNLRLLRMVAGVLIISSVVGFNINGQTRSDVIKVYNEGAKTVKTDVNASIEAFENVIKLAAEVGETCDDLRDRAIQILPGLYVRLANDALSEKKPAAELIKASKTAVAAAEKYNNETHRENANKLLVQGYYNLGNEYFNAKDYDNALLVYDSLLAINPDYTAAIFNKALLYRNQDDSENFEGTIDLCIEKASAANDTARAQQASGVALEYFRAAGSRANQADNLEEALDLLNKSAKYGDDKDLFYYFADVYNKQKNYNSGAEYAQKGLDMETGDAEAKAKFYYQLAVAQAGKGQNAEACASFKNAMYGPFLEASKAQRTNLKCQ